MGRSLGFALVVGLVGLATAACAAEPAAGVVEWIDTASGKLKTETFVSPQASGRPVLVVVLHGDAPFAKPSYQYLFARRAAASGDVVAAAILRPGYTDPTGDKSSGERGLTTGDNYTPDRIEMIVGAIRDLQHRHHARAVILVGHSGGAAISADILGLYPNLAQAALLVSCPCDLPAWRAHMKAVQHAGIWDRPVRSLSPVDLAARVAPGTRIRMIVGSADDVAPPPLTKAYATALARRGVEAQVSELAGKDHEIFLEPGVQEQLAALVEATRP
jgi:predicted esterase